MDDEVSGSDSQLQTDTLRGQEKETALTSDCILHHASQLSWAH